MCELSIRLLLCAYVSIPEHYIITNDVRVQQSFTEIIIQKPWKQQLSSYIFSVYQALSFLPPTSEGCYLATILSDHTIHDHADIAYAGRNGAASF